MIRLVREFSPSQFNWRNDSNILPFVRQNEPITLEHHNAWVAGVLKYPQDSRYFGIEVKEDSKFKEFIKKPEIVGYCGLSQIRDRTAEYSILIGPEHMGKGYGTKGLHLLLEYGFNTLDLEVIWGEIIEGNTPGLHIAEKLGFQIEGVLRSRYYKLGKRKSSTMVSLLKEEYGTSNRH